MDANGKGIFQSVMGFHGLEFILFRDGAVRTPANFNLEYEDGSGLNSKGENVEANCEKLRRVKNVDEAAFAAAVAGDLKNMTTLLAYE